MTERPILFSGPMVRALLAGTKTQTRRVIKNPHRNDDGFVLQDYGKGWWPYRSHDGESGCYLDRRKDGDYYNEAPLRCPQGRAGDQLWVRETWAAPHRYDHLGPSNIPAQGVRAHYAATEERGGLLWRPSIFMPRWASRITLEITGVRVEKLQDISEADAQAEGCALECMTPTGDDSGSAIYGPGGYMALWQSLNGAGSWDTNPWVWVVEFKRVTPAVSQQEQGE